MFFDAPVNLPNQKPLLSVWHPRESILAVGSKASRGQNESGMVNLCRDDGEPIEVRRGRQCP